MSDSHCMMDIPTFTIAMARLQPRSLNLSLFPCDALDALSGLLYREYVKYPGPIDEKGPGRALKRYNNLTELKIGPVFGGRYGYGMNGEEWLDPITIFRALTNLVTLELTNDYAMNKDFSVLPKATLPKLNTLTISKGVTQGYWPGAGLLECIKNVGPTLKHLRFQGIVLKQPAPASDDEPDDGPRPYDLADHPRCSLIRLLHDITPHTNLSSCTGLDSVMDIRFEGPILRTYVRPGPKPGKTVLVKKLEQAVCHQRQWPTSLSSSLSSYANPVLPEFEDCPGLDRGLSFMQAYWKDTVDEFELADERHHQICTTSDGK